MKKTIVFKYGKTIVFKYGITIVFKYGITIVFKYEKNDRFQIWKNDRFQIWKNDRFQIWKKRSFSNMEKRLPFLFSLLHSFFFSASWTQVFIWFCETIVLFDCSYFHLYYLPNDNISSFIIFQTTRNITENCKGTYHSLKLCFFIMPIFEQFRK